MFCFLFISIAWTPPPRSRWFRAPDPEGDSASSGEPAQKRCCCCDARHGWPVSRLGGRAGWAWERRPSASDDGCAVSGFRHSKSDVRECVGAVTGTDWCSVRYSKQGVGMTEGGKRRWRLGATGAGVRHGPARLGGSGQCTQVGAVSWTRQIWRSPAAMGWTGNFVHVSISITFLAVSPHPVREDLYILLGLTAVPSSSSLPLSATYLSPRPQPHLPLSSYPCRRQRICWLFTKAHQPTPSASASRWFSERSTPLPRSSVEGQLPR